jgi:hypothetical protein
MTIGAVVPDRREDGRGSFGEAVAPAIPGKALSRRGNRSGSGV